MAEAITPPRRRLRLRKLDHIIIVGLALALGALLLWPSIFVTIGAGQVGVLFRLFGGGTETRFVFHEGVAVKWPWDVITLYDVRTQAVHLRVDALTSDGLLVSLDITSLYHPKPNEAGFLHKELGQQYPERIVVPNSIQAVRRIVGQYDPHAIYTAGTFALAQDIITDLRKKTDQHRIIFDDLIIRTITLPEKVNVAINEKLTQEQLAEALEYKILQAKREAERKRIEAIGIQTFYSIVADALTPSLLTWRGIEATVEIAASSNTKIVIVGGGQDQMPLILGSDIGTTAASPAPAAVNPEGNQLPDLNKLVPLFKDSGPDAEIPSGPPDDTYQNSTPGQGAGQEDAAPPGPAPSQQ